MPRFFADCAGRTAVITGAASGIGAALAREAAGRGMNLLLGDVDEAGLAQTAAQCSKAVAVETMHVDVSNPEDVERMADKAYARFGEVGLLCNNAGVVPGGRHRPVWEYSIEDWRWAFDVNVFGIANGLKSFVPRLLEAGALAHILNTTSISGFISGGGSAVYGASKHAAVRLTEALYASLAEIDSPIGVSMLCPGLVNTRIFETERVRPPHHRVLGAEFNEPDTLRSIASGGMDPVEVARIAFDEMANGSFYILTTRTFDEMIAQRSASVLARTNPTFKDYTALSQADATTNGAIRSEAAVAPDECGGVH